MNIIEQSAYHLLSLISDVLDLTRVGTGKMELYQTDFNLLSLLDGVSKIINIRAQDKGINFSLEGVDALPNAVHGDERRLRQILLNLLDNALKFTVQGNVILTVSFNRPNSQLGFKIEDSGMGIAPENLENIFEPFEQVGKLEGHAKGTGLGLAISKHLVELMGGQLCVSSQINVGTQFWFELALPIVDDKITPQLNLTWDKVKKTNEENLTTQIVFPPIAELEKLYELSLMGDIDELEEQIAILAESYLKLKPFVTQIQAFLKKYQVNELSEWLEGKITTDG